MQPTPWGARLNADVRSLLIVIYPLIDPGRLFNALPDLPWKLQGLSVFGTDKLGYGTLPNGAKYSVAAWAKREIPRETGKDGPGDLLSVGMHVQYGHTLELAQTCYSWWLKNDKPKHTQQCDLEAESASAIDENCLYSLGIPQSHAYCYLGRYGNYVIRFHAELGSDEICQDERSFHERVHQLHRHVCAVLGEAI